MMKKSTVLFYAILFFLSIQSVKAQELDGHTLINEINTFYDSKNIIDLDIQFTMYKGFNGNDITEEYKGKYYMSTSVKQVIILNSEVIDFPEFKLIIDHENKTIECSNNSEFVFKSSPLDASMLLQYYTISTNNIENGIQIIEMNMKENVALPYSKIILRVHKETSFLESQELFFANKIPFVDKNGKQENEDARMKIIYKNSHMAVQRTPELEDYILISNIKIKDRIQPNQKYSDYSIIDSTNL